MTQPSLVIINVHINVNEKNYPLNSSPAPTEEECSVLASVCHH